MISNKEMGDVKERRMKSPSDIVNYLRKDYRWAYALIIAIFLTNVAYDYYFLTKETAPQSWDQSRHLMSSLSYYYILTSDLGFSDKISRMLQVDDYYPPFYHFSTVLMYFLFRDMHPSTAIMINVVYLGILVFSVYGIGRELFNKEAGLLASFLVAIYPVTFDRQHEYMIELALMAVVSLSIYFLLKSDHFKNLKYSLAFGFAFGISILTKWTALFFIIGPLVWICAETLYPLLNKKFHNKNVCAYCGKTLQKFSEYKGHKFCSSKCKNDWKKHKGKGLDLKPQIKNFGLMVIASLAVALPWYAVHLGDVTRTLGWGIEFWGASEGDPEILTLSSFVWYLFSMNYQLSFLFMILFLISLLFYLRSKHSLRFMLLLWMIIPYFVMTLLRNKNDGYTIAMASAIALITAFWLSFLDKKVKIPLLSFLLIFGIFQLYLPSAGYSLEKAKIETPFRTLTLLNNVGRPPIEQDWKVEETLKAILMDATKNQHAQGRAVYICVLPDVGYVNGLTYSYYSYLNKFPFNIYNAAYLGPQLFMQNFLNFDYLIIKTGENSGYSYQPMVAEIYRFFEQQSNDYILIDEKPLPDGSSLKVYRNNYKSGA